MDLATARAIMSNVLGLDVNYYPSPMAIRQVQERIDYLTEALDVFKKEN